MTFFTTFLLWVTGNYIEFLGSLTGIVYVVLSIRQNILLWPMGILSSGLYFIVFLQSGLYALMALQIFYILIGIYGWLHWYIAPKGKSNSLPTSRLTRSKLLYTCLGSVLVSLAIAGVLSMFPAGSLSLWDSLSSGISIVASILLARKIIEHWLWWMVVNTIVIGVSISQGLWATTALYAVLFMASIAGYKQWNQLLNKSAEHP